MSIPYYIARHKRLTELTDPSHPDYTPEYEHNMAALSGSTPSVNLMENISRLGAIKKCMWLDKKCGCQWGTCMNESHERHGKEVGYHDCAECKLMEIDHGRGTGTSAGTG